MAPQSPKGEAMAPQTPKGGAMAPQSPKGEVSTRDRLHDYLAEKGVGTVIHYPIPPHMQECYRPFLNPSLKGRTARFVIPDGGLPITEFLAEAELSLPISPCMTQEQVEYVVKCVNEFGK